MPNTRAFDENARAYDDWFEEHLSVYASELAAIRHLMPTTGRLIEIGVGTGRFAKPLGIEIGVEPSSAMRAIAAQRGINAIAGAAENIPVQSSTFDCALFVTTLCFLDSLSLAFSEAYRILKPEGVVVIGFIERESALGKLIGQRKSESRFYRDATFHTTTEVMELLAGAGFTDFRLVQTLFSEDETEAVQPVKEGYGDGAFIVIRGMKPGIA